MEVRPVTIGRSRLALFGPGNLEARDGPERVEAYVRGATWTLSQFAYLVRKLKETPEVGGGTLLDSTVLVCTSEFAYGNGHLPEYLPIIVAARGNGAITTGRHTVVPEQPVANLWVSLLEAAGVRDASGSAITRFGNSTRPLSLT